MTGHTDSTGDVARSDELSGTRRDLPHDRCRGPRPRARPDRLLRPDSTPWVVEQGPTAQAEDFPDRPTATTEARTDLRVAVEDSEGRLAARDEPLQVLTGELVDDATGHRLLPTVFRPDVTKEDEGQRCLCSGPPRTFPAAGVTLSVHYARPAEGLDLARLSVPGLEPGAPVPVG